MREGSGWSLRRAQVADAESLYTLLCIPEVYRYLGDDAAPPRSLVEEWIAQSQTDAAKGLGVWLLEELEDREQVLAGCVRLAGLERPRAAEITYLLDPRFWGRGLATRMSWSVVLRAFDAGCVDEIVAGADAPNLASVGVMRRLGMTFLRSVAYPLGTGVEYVLRRTDPAGRHQPETIPMIRETPQPRGSR